MLDDLALERVVFQFHFERRVRLLYLFSRLMKGNSNSGIQEIFARGIRNTGHRNPESRQRMNPEFICWRSVSNHMNGFHAYPCNHGHAKTQTADRADHVKRALFAAEFWLLQLAWQRQIQSWPIALSTSILKWPKFLTSYWSVFYSDSKILFPSKVQF